MGLGAGCVWAVNELANPVRRQRRLRSATWAAQTAPNTGQVQHPTRRVASPRRTPLTDYRRAPSLCTSEAARRALPPHQPIAEPHTPQPTAWFASIVPSGPHPWLQPWTACCAPCPTDRPLLPAPRSYLQLPAPRLQLVGGLAAHVCEELHVVHRLRHARPRQRRAVQDGKHLAGAGGRGQGGAASRSRHAWVSCWRMGGEEQLASKRGAVKWDGRRLPVAVRGSAMTGVWVKEMLQAVQEGCKDVGRAGCRLVGGMRLGVLRWPAVASARRPGHAGHTQRPGAAGAAAAAGPPGRCVPLLALCDEQRGTVPHTALRPLPLGWAPPAAGAAAPPPGAAP